MLVRLIDNVYALNCGTIFAELKKTKHNGDFTLVTDVILNYLEAGTYR